MMKKIILLLLMVSTQIYAESPTCNGQFEIKVSWPTSAPVWELCYLSPENSSAAQGSSLEIRDVYYNGKLVLERSHVPLLFANYETSLCYRDWKHTVSPFLKADRVENPRRNAITTCDASKNETFAVQDCPFLKSDGSGSVGDAANCFSGVQVEKSHEKLVLTTNHSADWYKYSARYAFYLDGRMQPIFGFGNSTGNLGDTTHWHLAYWRMNFDIDGSDNDQVFSDTNLMTTEFTGLRDESSSKNWSIIDSVTGRGYRVEPSENDYRVGTNPSGFGNHNVDVMATKYKLVGGIPEYSDHPGSNDLFDCHMNDANLVNNESLISEDVVFWYRTAVNDIANQGMSCKSAGPMLYPIGDWGVVDYIYAHDFD